MGPRGQLARQIAEDIVKPRCCQVARGESERQKEKEIVYCNQKKEEEKEKATTPAPVYLKSIKGYHHKILVFRCAPMEPAHLLLFSFPPLIPSRFAKAIRFPPPKIRKVEEEKEQKEHSLPRYGATAGDEIRNSFLRRRPSHATAPLVCTSQATPPIDAICWH